MACGCQNACGCIILGDGETASVVQSGTDTFIVSSIPTIADVDDTPCVTLTIDPELILTATLEFDPAPGPVTLECTPDGLRADLVIDPASTAIVSTSDDGLRVDVPPAPAGGTGGSPGDLVFHTGIGFRPNALDADGSAVPRAGYPDLWDALSLIDVAADRVSGDDQIAGIDSTKFIAPGMVVEATGFPFGMTVVSVDSSTAITVSALSTDSGSDTTVRVYPHGNGDGVSTFNVPLTDERYAKGLDYAGGSNALGDVTAPGASVTISETNLPLLTHDVNDPGHDHAATGIDFGHDHGALTGAAGSHIHKAGTAGNAYFVTVDDIAGRAQREITEAVGGAGNTFSIPTNTGTGASDFEQGTRQFTSAPWLTDGSAPNPTHEHAIATDFADIDVDVLDDFTGISVDSHGQALPDPIEVEPSHFVGRWMVLT